MTYEPGKYPKEYNPKVHGPYLPGRYYGKPDVPFGDVKIGDLGSWISRRSLRPANIWGAIHRSYWNWSGRWINARTPAFAGYAQMIMLLSAYSFFALYKDRSYHKHCKYH
ncbi:hypothetical protein BsWGS_05869 [Bradybaena similaris]